MSGPIHVFYVKERGYDHAFFVTNLVVHVASSFILIE